jgi:hypothetical protein
MDVESATWSAPTGSPRVVPAAKAAMTPTRGAVTSGLTAPSSERGPRLENEASESSRSTAPTVGAASAAPGVPTVDAPGPALPAATTKSAPVDAGQGVHGLPTPG